MTRDWKLRFYYASNVKPPKRPGELAIVTEHTGTSSRDMEIEVGKKRRDIGAIEMLDMRIPGNSWQLIYGVRIKKKE
jgi:hypothetical protein